MDESLSVQQSPTASPEHGITDNHGDDEDEGHTGDLEQLDCDEIPQSVRLFLEMQKERNAKLDLLLLQGMEDGESVHVRKKTVSEEISDDRNEEEENVSMHTEELFKNEKENLKSKSDEEGRREENIQQQHKFCHRKMENNYKLEGDFLKQQEIIAERQKQIDFYKQALEEVQAKEKRKAEMKYHTAAIKLQSVFRGFWVRKVTADFLFAKKLERQLRRSKQFYHEKMINKDDDEEPHEKGHILQTSPDLQNSQVRREENYEKQVNKPDKERIKQDDECHQKNMFVRQMEERELESKYEEKPYDEILMDCEKEKRLDKEEELCQNWTNIRLLSDGERATQMVLLDQSGEQRRSICCGTDTEIGLFDLETNVEPLKAADIRESLRGASKCEDVFVKRVQAEVGGGHEHHLTETRVNPNKCKVDFESHKEKIHFKKRVFYSKLQRENYEELEDQHNCPKSADGSTFQQKNEGSSVGQGSAVSMATKGSGHSCHCLQSSAEEKRLNWTQNCVCWSRLMQNYHQNKARPRKVIRKSKITDLPALSVDALLCAASCSSLQQVTTITFEDLSACSLCTLSQCPKLQSLTLRRCGLVSLDGLSSTNLQLIDVQENSISYVNCRGLAGLRVLLLSKNELTSICGLDDAFNLEILELSHNHISRTGGLESLRRLQKLVIDHNQLICTKGLRDVLTLTYLDCSHNHLSHLDELGNCALLQTLKAQGNNLTQPPSLLNHVLLRELYLDNNIISSVHSLSACWLPLLLQLSLSHNSMIQLPPLADFVSLLRLDISHNCISELSHIQRGLEGCWKLKEIHVTGNPFQHNSSWRTSLLQALPSLNKINGECSRSMLTVHVPATGGFMSMCEAQLVQMEEMQQRHEAELRHAVSPVDVLSITIRHNSEHGRLSVEHRCAHEHAHLASFCCSEENSLVEGLQTLSLSQTQEQEIFSSAETQRTPCEGVLQNITCKCAEREMSPTESKRTNVAALVVQRYWQRYKCHSQERARSSHLPTTEMCFTRSQAATLIQAVWKGFSLRKKLASALASVQISQDEDNLEKVDLNEFDEAALQECWMSFESAQTLTYSNKNQVEHFTWIGCSALLPWKPEQVWTKRETESSLCSEPTVSPVGSDNRMKMSSVSGSALSEKCEQILEEWGFTERKTALMMLKRAQKMSPNKQERKPNDDCKTIRAGPHWIRRYKTQKVHPEHKKRHHFLPEIDPDVLNGGRVQLVVGSAHTDSIDQESTSVLSSPKREHNQTRKLSAGSMKTGVPTPAKVRRPRGSFYDKRVQMSCSWGSSKKKDKI